ncbi:MAG TPA: hypothetical protein VFH61_00560 [Thermoleophilia bacterium]|nr:hypothetical protein [Thermoleophilia bacterium]
MIAQALYDVDKKRRLWLADLRAAEKRPRVLVHVPEPVASDRENCVMCDASTENWLYPENAPICGPDCLDKYLVDPSVYDPRGLHTLKVIMPEKKPRKVSKPKRWEPSEDEIEVMRERIKERREKTNVDNGERRRDDD